MTSRSARRSVGVSRVRRSRRGEDGLTEVRDARFFLLKAVMCFTLARIGVGCNSGSCEIAKSRGSVLTEDRVRLYNRPSMWFWGQLESRIFYDRRESRSEESTGAKLFQQG